jgi:MarR family transcriptional regulator, 2-MHQ and catechol-resistance regulon repressor
MGNHECVKNKLPSLMNLGKPYDLAGQPRTSSNPRCLDEKNLYIRISHLLTVHANRGTEKAFKELRVMDKKPSAGQLWVVLARCHKSLTLLVERSVANTGLILSDFMILEALLHKGPLAIGEIQVKVLLASGSMTAAVDRLERKGCIVRKPDAHDRRARVLHLTREGRGLITKILAEHLAELQTWVSVLNQKEMQQVYAALKKLGLHAAAIYEAENAAG